MGFRGSIGRALSRASLLAVLVVAVIGLSAVTLSGSAVALDAEEQAFLRIINDYRAADGLAPLSVNSRLNDIARWMSQDMVANDYFGHTDSLGRDPFQRMDDFGYTYNTWRGENLAAGVADAQAAFELWRNSPGHNANLLNPNFKVIGIARAYGPETKYGWYWATEFGGQSEPLPPGNNAVTISGADGLTHTGADGDTIAHAGADGDTITHTGADGDTIAHTGADGLTHTGADGDTIAHAGADGDTIAHAGADGDTIAHAEADGDTIAHAGADGDTIAHAGADGDTIAHAEADGDTIAHAGADGDTIAHTGADDVSAVPHTEAIAHTATAVSISVPSTFADAYAVAISDAESDHGGRQRVQNRSGQGDA